jgi:hypothetical protein
MSIIETAQRRLIWESKDTSSGTEFRKDDVDMGLRSVKNGVEPPLNNILQSLDFNPTSQYIIETGASGLAFATLGFGNALTGGALLVAGTDHFRGGVYQIIRPQTESEVEPVSVKSNHASSEVDTRKMVPVDTVVRTTAAIVGSFSLLAFIANLLAGVIILQPFVSLLLIVASIGFYAMSIAKSHE